MKYLRYYSEFISRAGTAWRIEIHQDAENRPEPEFVEMTSDPLQIEWAECDKLDPVQSSCATINLISMSDRQFVDLYSIDPEQVRMDVMRDGKLYWSGVIDPELYEEPYSFQDRYIVSITFSDFAILDRKDWHTRGFVSIGNLIEKCIEAATFRHNGIERYISTGLKVLAPGDIFEDCLIFGENFFDEDDDPMTFREVLDGVLQPFAMKIIQKNGNIYIYDLNEMFYHTPHAVEWQGADATLGVDKVYNNVTVTFSPYGSGNLISLDVEKKDLPKTDIVDEVRVMVQRRETQAVGFDISIGTPGKGTNKFDIGTTQAAMFHISPIYSGNEERGVAWCVYPDEIRYLSRPAGVSGYSGSKVPVVDNVSIFRSIKRVFIGDYIQYNGRLKVTLDLLFDVRYNPFESADEYNMEDMYDHLQNWCNFAYVPFALRLYDSKMNMRYRYNNVGIEKTDGYNRDSMGFWEKSNDMQGMSGFLCYYNNNNRKSQSGLGGWHKNRPIIGYYRGELPSGITKLSDGEYIPLPPESGWLELEIFAGVHQFDYKREVKNIYARTRWVLYKNPTLSLVDTYGKNIEPEDIETKAWINKQASEELSISTIIGTCRDPNAFGRGYIWNVSKGLMQMRFCRAGVEDFLERLLIGTIYSNHSIRANTLSGTMRTIPEFCILYDKSDVYNKYVILSEVEHPAIDQSEVKMVQMFSDDYTGVDYDENI